MIVEVSKKRPGSRLKTRGDPCCVYISRPEQENTVQGKVMQGRKRVRYYSGSALTRNDSGRVPSAPRRRNPLNPSSHRGSGLSSKGGQKKQKTAQD